MEHYMGMKSSKGYQLDDDEHERLSSLAGVTVYTLESTLAEAIYPVFEYFLRDGGSGEAERPFRMEAERHSGMIPNTIGA